MYFILYFVEFHNYINTDTTTAIIITRVKLNFCSKVSEQKTEWLSISVILFAIIKKKQYNLFINRYIANSG